MEPKQLAKAKKKKAFVKIYIYIYIYLQTRLELPCFERNLEREEKKLIAFRKIMVF